MEYIRGYTSQDERGAKDMDSLYVLIIPDTPLSKMQAENFSTQGSGTPPKISANIIPSVGGHPEQLLVSQEQLLVSQHSCR